MCLFVTASTFTGAALVAISQREEAVSSWTEADEVGRGGSERRIKEQMSYNTYQLQSDTEQTRVS
uniref:Uncharacterized protein n=1 Tax=Phakopsora pachyrhizi TaxID=170000 RepID=A0A0S1MJ27_PHAPC